MEPRFYKATLEDLDLLVQTRVKVLLAANRLPDDTDMSTVEQASRDYYTAALADGSHAAWLVFDGDTWIGAGGVSFYRVMPTYHNPSGQKAYLMNIYTHPDYRRRGLGRQMAELLDANLKGERTMEFQGFDASELEQARRQYADEAKARWGHTDAWKESQEKNTDANAQAEGVNDIFRRAATLRQGDPASPEAQALVKECQCDDQSPEDRLPHARRSSQA